MSDRKSPGKISSHSNDVLTQGKSQQRGLWPKPLKKAKNISNKQMLSILQMMNQTQNMTTKRKNPKKVSLFITLESDLATRTMLETIDEGKKYVATDDEPDIISFGKNGKSSAKNSAIKDNNDGKKSGKKSSRKDMGLR